MTKLRGVFFACFVAGLSSFAIPAAVAAESGAELAQRLEAIVRLDTEIPAKARTVASIMRHGGIVAGGGMRNVGDAASRAFAPPCRPLIFLAR